MNIFRLDNNPEIAAQMMCDKHIVKMAVETSQLLSTAHRVLSDVSEESVIYRKTHVNHPSSMWVRESKSNYDWTYQHLVAIWREYTIRYSKTHLSEKKLSRLLSVAPRAIPDVGDTPFKLAMGSNPECVTDDPVESYIQYYRKKSEIMQMTWTKRKIPEILKSSGDM